MLLKPLQPPARPRWYELGVSVPIRLVLQPNLWVASLAACTPDCLQIARLFPCDTPQSFVVQARLEPLSELCIIITRLRGRIGRLYALQETVGNSWCGFSKGGLKRNRRFEKRPNRFQLFPSVPVAAAPSRVFA